ncbi:Serine/Threonine protein kinase and Signal Transduction Histidine Kinase (STHK) with GAF sensor [Trichormus variabilis ATCC 29413]|uniref:histidine kinase n=2 Tax=Anabaena variabilis TaxID=264691 RepID=Q3M5Y6_TRIV2|nr:MULTISPECIES: ATP-binding sensor histidine kinase [Nostocaceae]ABA23600.1 Serine/Threonine protein kinase and Signal Transduction Histidine Kinase (STHK) with GAF sensor [Trichormus variabilis ATCC 29413]MBC1213858.1 AAA family ATPase [Trichormus variabilis ARAD]MBC1254356.1 AAA family ATPase [Trichormus variabilis V5]MBC1265738.1 AAA family ATPase [Trichormus variabilis FSR]MBC1301390.1 AAA family ATPase [Trichormus variabilis N2B]
MTSTVPQFPEISGYTITEQIYRGSRTAVYLAIQDNQRLPVVIKVLQREYATFGELVQFRNQYAIAKNLPITGIIPPLSLEPFGNGYALVMADWGGISLETYIQQQPLDLGDILVVAIQLADILHELQQHRVIHKDIKPANILIHPESQQVKLIDFSIASVLPKETQEIQNPNTLEGTLAYLSPEQTGRMNRGIDYRSDFYALGVTLYQLLTGRLPFLTDDPLELVHCHIAKIATPVHLVNTDVPPTLGAIVAKLMAKNAEDRYQSALGLKHDLDECWSQWKQTGSIAEFELGQKDLCDRFLIPEKLYGRETEVQTLLDAFERVAQGSSEMMLVAGFSGIGKTAVVNEVHKPIVKQRGYFIKGKFDQFNRNIPFSAFVQGFQDLVGQLLSESDTQLQHWKTQILSTLGENAQVIVELIPELERIIGVQPPTRELSGTAAQNRFNLLFQRFIQVFTTPAHPLVMFVDDLQWADSASLNLIQVLMSESQTGCLLLLGAYRDNEVFAAHPLMLTLNGMEKAGAKIHTITLQPLSFTSLNHLIADTLHTHALVVQPLTKLVMQKTLGNPFFATQFLKALHQDQLITFDPNAGHWQCDIVQVRDVALTDDVLELMVQQLQKMPEATQEILKLAACIGAQFDLTTLAIVSQQSQTEVATILWKALQEGLILPQSDLYKFYLGESQAIQHTPQETLNYRFLHDRVQQAAYSLILDDQKQVTHLTIGKLLLENSNPSFQDSHLFAIVHQLNCGISMITELEQRYQYAQLNLQAGYKAKDSTAYNAALHYFDKGMQFLPTDSWDKNYNLTLLIYESAAEVALLSCDFKQMDTLIQIVLKNTNDLLEQVKVYEIKLQAYQVQNQQLQAIKIGREILQKLGVILPESITLSDIQRQVQHTLTKLSNYSLEDLINLPITQDATATAAARIMTSLVPSIHQANPLLFPVVACEEVNLSLQYGNSLFSAPGYADFSIIVSSVLNEIEVGYRFGQLALQLMEKFNESYVQSIVMFKVAAFNQSNQQDIRNAIFLLNKSYKVAIETGDSVHALVSTSFRLFYSYLSGDKPLPELLEEVEIYQSKFATSEHFLTWVHIISSSIHNFIELSDNPDCLGSIDAENEKLSTLIQENDELALHLFYLSKLILSYSFSCFETAIQIADRGLQYLKAGISMPSAPAYYYYDSLTRLKLYFNFQPSSQKEVLRKVDSNQKHLLVYVNAAPMNYQHKYHLVEAVRFQRLGKQAEAIEFFDCAIAGAKANRFIQDEALANELAAEFYLNWGKDKFAAGYIQEAYYCYSRWGAKAKVTDLETRYPELLRPILQQTMTSTDALTTLMTIAAPAVSVHYDTHHTSSSTGVNQVLDFAAILKASQVLSRTIQLDQLLQKLTQIILHNSGGDRCALLFPNETGEWQVRAIATPDDVQLIAEPFTNNPNIPVKLIQYVKNNQETVVIDDLKTDLPVIDDYLRQRQPKSILCLPLLNQGHLIGILYLKNRLTRGVFTSDRLLILNFLCIQAAISLENARLYQQAQTYARQLEQSQLQMIQSEKMASLGNLVAGVAHEINNPIGFLNGSIKNGKEYVQDLLGHLALYQQHYPNPVEAIQDNAKDIDWEFLSEDLPKLLDSMEGATNRINSISNSLRTFSRADTEYKISANLHEGLDSTLLILKYRLKANEHRPAIQVIQDLGDLPTIKCFPGQLNQVFMNILANAIDMFDEMAQTRLFKELEANPQKITIRTEVISNQVYIRIRDNGKGITQELQEKIFDHLFTTKAVGKGTGLGLAIARQIVVEKHGGSLNVWSELGQGTEFTVQIPV